MTTKPSLGLNRVAFPFAAILSLAILGDLFRQGYPPEDLAGYAAILMIILYEYRR